MKTNIKNLAISFIAISTTFFACTKEPLEPLNMRDTNETSFFKAKPAMAKPNPNQNVEESAVKPKPSMEDGDLINTKWKISHFITDQKDLTDVFKTYSVGFYQNSEMIGMKGEYPMQKGKWQTKLNGKKFIQISFDNALPYSNLNGNWTIVEQLQSKMVMETVDGASKSQVTLEK